MMNNEEGFTLIELLVTLSLFALLSLFVISIPGNIYHNILLKSTAVEIKEALYLTRQLSLDESKSYCVILTDGEFKVKEDVKGGRVVLIQKLNKNISVPRGANNTISYTRDGEATYEKFILTNKRGREISIDTLIGAGRVRVSDIY